MNVPHKMDCYYYDYYIIYTIVIYNNIYNLIEFI